MKGKKVRIIEGEYKDKTGIIIYVYEGWWFEEYTILLDESQEEVVLYHDEVKLI